MNPDELQSRTIDWLRFPLMVCVVFIHSFGLPETVIVGKIDFGALTGMDVYNLIRVTTRTIESICNPGFFLFSGFLFFRSSHAAASAAASAGAFTREMYLRKLKSRARTLLIPYILWNAIAVAATPLVIAGGRIVKGDGDWGRLAAFLDGLREKGVGNIFWHYNTWGERVNVFGRVTASMGPYSVPLWFLETLIVLSLCAPVIYFACARLRMCAPALLAAAWYTGWWPLLPGFKAEAWFFFTLGAYYGVAGKNLVAELRRPRLPCAVLAAVTLPLCVYFYDAPMKDFFSPVFVFTALVCAVNLAARLVETGRARPVPLLTRSIFFIYALHTILVLSVAGLVFDLPARLAGWDGGLNPALLTLRYFTVPSLAIAICVAVYAALGRIAPGLQRTLSGGR